MALINMVMPKMGESVMEGTILNWLKKVGDTIEQDEAVLEVATDKVDTEIPAIQGGILKEILAQVGDVIQVGKAIAVIETDQDQTSSPSPVASPIATNTLAESKEVEKNASSSRFYSPLVLNIARQEGISMVELEEVEGSGKDGRITKNDILDYLKNRSQKPVAPKVEAQTEAPKPTPQAIKPAQTVTPVQPAVSFSGRNEIIEMDRMRKMIAQRMVDSKRISPHVTSFVEADVTNIVRWRDKIKDTFRKREGINLTYTTIFMMAVVRALQEYPMLNSSIDGDRIVVKKDINLGMAVALPSGNLIVPVIKGAAHLNMAGMAHKVNELANKARTNQLTPDDLSDGTYTVSNIGSFGNMLGTPIILQPQVGILSLGAVIKKPAVIETPEGDMIGIRQMMFLSHSYDHRIIDGALGGKFVRKVADYLEAFDTTQNV